MRLPRLHALMLEARARHSEMHGLHDEVSQQQSAAGRKVSSCSVCVCVYRKRHDSISEANRIERASQDALISLNRWRPASGAISQVGQAPDFNRTDQRGTTGARDTPSPQHGMETTIIG